MTQLISIARDKNSLDKCMKMLNTFILNDTFIFSIYKGRRRKPTHNPFQMNIGSAYSGKMSVEKWR